MSSSVIQNEPQDRAYAQEALIVDVTEEIWGVMNEKKITKTDLAERLNCSKAHVTQLLNGARNMTLRTLADIARVLGTKFTITLGKPEPDWRPIETHDGSSDMVIGSSLTEGWVTAIERHEDVWRVANNPPTDAWGRDLYPTHWMPMPEPLIPQTQVQP